MHLKVSENEGFEYNGDASLDEGRFRNLSI